MSEQQKQSLRSVSAIDGRYQSVTSVLSQFFSEYAYIRSRIMIELRYFAFLSHLKILRAFTEDEHLLLESILSKFSEEEALRVKEIEKITLHDVKAIEYYIKEKLKGTSLEDVLHYIHFGLTSEDINNLAISFSTQKSLHEVVLPTMDEIVNKLSDLAKKYQSSPFLALTHGQPAVPTTFGKELAVYVSRLSGYHEKLKTYQFSGKLNGAVGNYNALDFAYPDIDWEHASCEFIQSLKLSPCLVTTQILPGDTYVDFFLLVDSFNAVLKGLCVDMWLYISRGVITLNIEKGQVGSSTMPQKVNPIQFENAEGNIALSHGVINVIAERLSTSRMQRDLTDSTVKRSFGTALGYSLIAWKSLSNGLRKIALNEGFSKNELENHYEVIMEGVQTLLKKHGIENAYETIKEKSQGKVITKEVYAEIITSLSLSNEIQQELLNLTPFTYIGRTQKIINSI